MRPMIQRLIVISRMASWPCALLVGAWVAWSLQPLTVGRLLLRTGALQFSYADIYSELHEQPFGWCDTYYAQREEALAIVHARAKDLDASSLRSVLTLVRDYDATMGAHYEEDCRAPWRGYQNPANFQKVFTWDYPLYYVVSQFRVTEIRLALAQLVAGWLGVVGIALLSVYFWRSPLAPIAGLALTSWLAKQTFVRVLMMALPGAGSTLVVDPSYLFPAVTMLLLIAMMRPVLKRDGTPTPMWMTAALALVYGLHTMLYYVIDPPIARMFALVGLVYVGAVGLAYRRWQVVGGAVLAAAMQVALDAVFRRPGQEIYAAVTMASHLTSEAYTNIMIYMGLFERPTPFGLFYMDEIFGWIIDQDPVLVRAAPFMAVHHSYAAIGSAMVHQAIVTEPLTVLDAVFRRLLVQVFHRPLWFFWTLKVDWVYTSLLLSLFAVNAWAWRRKALFLVITPITLCLLVNQFAVNTVMTLVHTHSRWNQIGVMLMFAVAPLYVVVAVKLLCSTAWKRPDWRMSALRSHPYRVAGVVLALVVSVWFVQFSVKTLKQERQFVRVWMTIHKPPPEGVNVPAIVGTLEAMRAETGDRRGEIAMWIATILRMQLGRATIASAEQRAELDAMRQRYYRLALAAAPDNPHFLFAAWFLQIDGWEAYLLQGLTRFPDAVYAPGAAAALHYYGKGLPDATRESVARQYETLTGRFLSTASRRVPGFLDVPALVQTESGSVTATKTEHPGGRAGLVLTMSPGAIAFLSDTPTYGSSQMRLFSYVDLQDGDVEPAMAFGGAGRQRTLAAATARTITKDSQRLSGRYQFFESGTQPGATTFGMWLRAGAKGATVEVRDYYPIVDYPGHAYRSGLMERVRRRAARQGHAR